jgi:glutamate-1-semialdehyde 2,1-aminomutase
MLDKYKISEKLLERALKTIPLGSQTFSKSKTQYPIGVSPFFIRRGFGCYVWDVDDNKYIDFVNGLASLTLGYCDDDVDSAVRAQLENGVIFSLPHPLEVQVAEKIVEMVPCAEMVRFGKNGSDATAGAIRLARAFTGRDHVAICGYHGWQDWYIGTTLRNKGVPKAVQGLSHSFPYNDLDSLSDLFKKYPQQIAAVIVEPMSTTLPHNGYLEGLKDICHRNGALLIFDETITGFRFAKGGAQELFGVTPDLATFGKGIANGYPLSVVCGRRDVMRLMEDVFFSFTFGGEALSLSAALATMSKLQREPVIETLYTQGKKIIFGINKLIKKYNVGHFASVVGNPTWSFFILKDVASYSMWQLKTLYMQEMLSRGILTLGTHNLSYKHGDAEVEKLLAAYEEVLAIIAGAVSNGTVDSLLRCATLEPLFKVR